MIRSLVEYECPTCNAEYATLPERAGSSTHCDHCNTNYLVPNGLRSREIEVSDSNAPAIPLTPEEAAAVRRALATNTPIPSWVTQGSVAPDALQDGERRARCTVPVRMNLPKGLGGMEVPVTQGTANSMAQTFLGAMLLAIGVTLAAMLGIRKRS
jgi:DNA-directed RNA polymerase subunit RPC12/RpoP